MAVAVTHARRGKPSHPASFVPWPCIVLAVDTAESSGWSVWHFGEYCRSGEFDLQRFPFHALEVCTQVMAESIESKLRCVLVLEAPFAGLAQGQWRGSWRTAWAQAASTLGVRGARQRVVQVQPSTWRARVLAPGMHAAPREVVRPHEQMVAARIAGRTTGSDESPAVLIGFWAANAGEVGTKVMPSSRRARRGARA